MWEIKELRYSLKEKLPQVKVVLSAVNILNYVQ